MAFGDFRFPKVRDDLGLTLVTADFSSKVNVSPIREDFAQMIAYGTTLAVSVNTEKARSEFIIAPILLELGRQLKGRVSIYSGTELNVDPSRGLNGVCDFIIGQTPHQLFLAAPLVTIVEAKSDNVNNGLGQCIASMVAAQLFNERAGEPIDVVHGVVTTGSAWRFLRLEGTTLTLDLGEYYVDNLPKILGLLRSLVVPEPIEIAS